MDTHVELTRRRLLTAVIASSIAGWTASSSTAALFHDTESSTGNQIQSGTLDLSFGNGGSFGISATLEPGQSTTGSVTLVNSGSVTGSVDVTAQYSENDATNNANDVSADDVAKYVNVVTLDYGGTDLTGQIPDVDGNGRNTLYDLANTDAESDGDDIIDLADPGSGTDFTVEFEVESTVGNTYEDDGVDITFAFDLNQVDSQ